MTTIDNNEFPRAGSTTSAQGQGFVALAPQASRRPAAIGRQAARPGRARRARRAGTGIPAALLAVDSLAVLLTVAPVGAGDLLGTLWAACGIFPVLVLLNSSGGLYRLRLAPSVLDELPGLCGRAAAAAAIALTLDRCLHGLWPHAVPEDGRALLTLLGCQLALCALGRGAVYAVVGGGGGARTHPRPTLVAGAGRIGRRVAAALLEHPEYGLHPVGYIDSEPLLMSSGGPVPVLGGPEVLGLEIAAQDVTDVIITAGGGDDTEAATVLRTVVGHGCEVWFVPDVPDFGAFRFGNSSAAVGDHLWGFPCLRLSRTAMKRPGWAVKRGADVVLAGTGLLLLTPVLAACALAVRLDCGPEVIFRQERVGLDGDPFTVFKFRTLRPDDDHESATRWNISQDHRLGATGRFLRRTSLDELPQLWNVLRGEMSLVGPRPERPYFVARFSQSYPQYRDRHRVPVGITGFAQVNGLRGDTSIEDRIRFDNYYIESWTLWQDVKILLRTISSVLRPDGS
jgi:exopolysaccharide biosynthesis polyprenyl glycosylphosphotransferase